MGIEQLWVRAVMGSTHATGPVIHTAVALGCEVSRPAQQMAAVGNNTISSGS